MPIPPGGFSGTTEDPRPPTLDELRKIWSVAKHFNLSHDFETESITVSFKISKQDCAELGIHLRTFGSQFLGELNHHLDRMAYFDELVKQYTDPGATGARVEDCINFMENEYAQVREGEGLATTMRRRMFRTTVQKLAELKAWRIFVDKERFQREQEQFRAHQEDEKRRRAEEARMRKAQEEMNQQQQQWKQRYQQTFDEEMRSHYDFFRDAFKDRFNQGNQRGQHDDSFSWDESSTFKKRRRTQDKVRPDGKWWEVLGVKVTATKAEIKSAWRHLAKTNHPDRGGSSAKMAEINAAKDEGLAGARS